MSIDRYIDVNIETTPFGIKNRIKMALSILLQGRCNYFGSVTVQEKYGAPSKCRTQVFEAFRNMVKGKELLVHYTELDKPKFVLHFDGRVSCEPGFVADETFENALEIAIRGLIERRIEEQRARA